MLTHLLQHYLYHVNDHLYEFYVKYINFLMKYFHFVFKDHNFVQFWCLPLLTPELYINKIFQEASNTDPEVNNNKIKISLFFFKELDCF